MTKLKLNPKKSLGRVLSLDEMKSIFGGSNATITCTCTLVKYYETEHEEHIQKEPKDPFYTAELCQEACDNICGLTPYCDFAFGNYSISYGGSSGSEGSE